MEQKNIKTIGIVALSGIVEPKKVMKAVSYLEFLGFRVKIASNVFDKKRYLAGDEEQKLSWLYRFYEDSEIDLILNARGGYGAIRLVNKINYDIIKNNPKPFCGFSDVTALLLMIYKKTGQITYHGPMLTSDFNIEPGVPSFSAREFLKTLNNSSLEFKTEKTYVPGRAEGIIWGGNLSTVASLCGLDFIPDENFVFFAEDLNEPVYKIDKMFQQLFNIEKFQQRCKGIILGDFLDVDNEAWLEELFKEFEIPVFGGFKITHLLDKITVPIGSHCIVDEDKLVID